MIEDHLEQAFSLLIGTEDEVPIAAVIVDEQNRVIAGSTNECQKSQNPLRHAELISLEKAFQNRNHSLAGCSIYITLEPCLMCYGAIVNSGIKKIVYALKNTEDGAISYHHVDTQKDGVLAYCQYDRRSEELLKSFFAKRRAENK